MISSKSCSLSNNKTTNISSSSSNNNIHDASNNNNHLMTINLGQCQISPPSILSTSPSTSTSTSSSHPKNSQTQTQRQRILLADRKSFFSHLKPKSLLLSTTRISIVQSTTLFSTYLTDQLEYEYQMEELHALGQITPSQLDQRTKEWEEREWKERMKVLPSKIVEAVSRFHVVTLVMRGLECGVCDGLLGLDDGVMDRLTKDVFGSAVRKGDRLDRYLTSGPRKFRTDGGGNNNKGGGKNVSSTSTSTSTSMNRRDSSGGSTTGNTATTGNSDCEVTSRRDLGEQMFYTCLWSNAINFLADHTVQQCILVYGYYKYCTYRRRLARMEQQSSDVDEELKLKEEEEKEESSLIPSPTPSSNSAWGIFLSFLIKSSKISVSRGFALIVSSFGGAVGSMIRPGWGTVAGSGLGDALVGALLD